MLDKVWKILPKEYRQFVQKTYLDLSDKSSNDYVNRPIYAEQVMLLEKMYGKDNLNDCEEIDDVLYVKHQDVIDDFADAENVFTNTTDRNVKNQMFGKIAELKKLFGWNCSKEEIQSEDVIKVYQEKVDRINDTKSSFDIGDKNTCGNTTHVQPQNKFTVGQRVHVKNGLFYVGEDLIITKYEYDEGEFLYWFEGKKECIDEARLKACNENLNSKVVLPKYQKGAKVEYSDKPGEYIITNIERRLSYGKEYIVYTIVKTDGSKSTLFAKENEIRLCCKKNNEVVTEENFNLCKLLEKYKGEKFFSPTFGEMILKDVVSFKFYAECTSSFGREECFDTDGKMYGYGQTAMCQFYPNRELYEKYPFDPISAWREWQKETRRFEVAINFYDEDKQQTDGILLSFKTKEEADNARNTIKTFCINNFMIK